MKSYPKAYVAYLVEFHTTRDFFECHELLEEYWKEHPGDGHGDIWIGLIQLAVGQYHERRGNLKGAAKMYAQSFEKLSGADLGTIGLHKEALLLALQLRQAISENGISAYEDIHLQLSDDQLLQNCLMECRQRSLNWGSPSPLQNEEIIHRHKLRDRSEVLSARAAALQAKNKGNGH